MQQLQWRGGVFADDEAERYAEMDLSLASPRTLPPPLLPQAASGVHQRRAAAVARE
jgi:hypothetical protein